MYNNYGATNYSAYGSYPGSTNAQTLQALNTAYSNNFQTAAAPRTYSQPVTSANANPLGAYAAYDYNNVYKTQSAENPYGVGAQQRTMPIAPVGFQSAGTLSSVNSSASSLAYAQAAAAAAQASQSTSGLTAGTHYSGYNEAVLAVTTDYIASKNPSAWLNASQPNSDLRTFPSKKRSGFGHRPVAKDVQTFFCEVCKISCAGKATYNEHLNGKNHKKKEAMASGKNQISLPKNKVCFKCEVCDITCSGKDTYEAHAKGIKHQKTLVLLRKMGQVPNIDPIMIAPEGSANATVAAVPAQIPTVGSEAVPVQKTKVIGVTTTRFVGGSNLTTTDNDDAEKNALEAALELEAQIQPVGEEFVDSKYDAKGKLVEYHCRLCDCSFSDPNAKAVHTKGRRHRLAYKAKVDPKLKVEMKGSILNSKQKRNEKAPKFSSENGTPLPLFNNMPSPAHTWISMDNSIFAANHESPDDKHVLQKYNEVRIDDAKLEGLNRLVDIVESALKSVSDKITEEDFTDAKPVTPVKKEEIKEEVAANGEEKVTEEKKEAESAAPPQRVLKGLMKVGLLANGILMNDDSEVDLVVICAIIPTKKALGKVIELLPQNFDVTYQDKLKITAMYEAARVLIEVGGFDVKVRITFTCPSMREYEGKNAAKAAKELPKDSLPLEPCLAALAELRRAKFYQAKAQPLEGMNLVMVVLRDIRNRVNTWEPLNSWILTMLCQNVLESFGFPMTPGDALRRVFEAISCGILLSKRAVLYDPCEKEKVDAMEPLNAQQREDITSSAQHALRLIIFDQIHKILDMERIENAADQTSNGNRKRTFVNDENSGEEVELKKEKSSS